MRVHPRLTVALSAVVTLATALSLNACDGTDRRGGGPVHGDVLNIYASQPLRGLLATDGRDLVRAESLALQQARGRAGKFAVRMVSLDNTSPKTLRWAPDVVVANARRAAQDPKTIAYLGEFDTGASAVAIPVLNETGILEVSPTDSVAGFTREFGGVPGEPDKYYPTRDHNFARLVPPDDIQARVAAELFNDENVKRVAIVTDDGQYGQALGLAIERTAVANGITVPLRRRIDALDDDRPPEEIVRTLLPDLLSRIQDAAPDAVIFATRALPAAPVLLRELHAADPQLKLYATDALAVPAVVAALGPAGDALTLLSPALPPRIAGAAAAKFVREFRAAYGVAPSPFAAYGYEAMRSVLEAIESAGRKGNDRSAVIDALLRSPERQTAVGPLRFDSRGDPASDAYAAYGVRAGRLRFLRVVAPAAPPRDPVS
jgi:branched-chain amino acid transport system substrate-binding protein